MNLDTCKLTAITSFEAGGALSDGMFCEESGFEIKHGPKPQQKFNISFVAVSQNLELWARQWGCFLFFVGGGNTWKIENSVLAQKVAAKAYFWTIFGPQTPKSYEGSFSGAKTAKSNHLFGNFLGGGQNLTNENSVLAQKVAAKAYFY